MADYTGKITAYNGHPMYEGRPVGQFSDPAGTAADFVFNAGYDFIDMASGLKTMGNAATARFYEGVPTPQNQGVIKPWIRPAEDFETAKQMGGAIIGNYAHSYVDPILQGRPLDLGSHAIAHPVNTLMDVTAVGSLLRLPKMMSRAMAARAQAAVGQPVTVGQAAADAAPVVNPTSAIENALDKQAAADFAKAQQQAQEAAAKAAQAQAKALAKRSEAVNTQSAQAQIDASHAQAEAARLEQAANDAARQAHDIAARAAMGAQPGTPIGDIIDRANAIKDKLLGKISDPEAAKIAEPFKTGVLAEEAAMTDDLGKYWNKIPGKLRDEVQAYAEGWHPTLIAGGKAPKEIADYLARAEEYATIMRGRIDKVTNALDLALDKYQPAAIKLNGFTTAQWQGMTRKTQLDILNFTKKQMNAKGITPQYSPHVLKGEVNNVLRNPTTMQKDIAKDPTKAHFLKTKQSDGSKAVKSHYDSMRTRWIQISQFQQAYEKIIENAIDVAKQIEVLKNAPDAAAQQIAKEVQQALEAEYSLQAQALDKALKADATAQDALKQAVEEFNQLTKHAEEMTNKAMAIQQAESEAAAKAAQAAADAAKATAKAKAKEAAAKKAEAKVVQEMAEKAQAALDEHLGQPAASIAQQMADKGYASLSGQALVETVLGGLEGSVLSADEITKLASQIMPGEIYLPKEMIQAINQAMKSNRKAYNPMVAAYDRANTFAKRYQLGGNLTYGPAQTVQAIGMLEMVSLNGIRSTVTSVLSYGLAFNKKVRAAVPLSIADDVLASTVTTQRYLQDAVDALFNQPVMNKTPGFIQKPLKGMVSAYETFIDFNLKAGAVGDSFVRAKAGIHYALMIAQENTPLGQAVREMFDTTKSVHLVESTFLDPAAKMNVAKQVGNALGNFKEISEMSGMKVLGRLTPYPAWLAFITKYTLGLPVNHPYKSVLLNNIAQLQEQYVADPDVPKYLKGAVRIDGVGPNGLPLVVVKEGMNPLTSMPQLIEAVSSAMSGQGDESLASLTPAPFQLAFMLTTRLNPMTLKDFDDPALIKVGDKQYSQFDVESENIGKGIAQPIRPVPDPLALGMRSFFPVQARWVEAVMEKAYSGGARSQMSSLLHSAPKRDKRTGEVKQAPDWITLLINNLVNENPIEFDPDSAAIDEKFNWQTQQQADRALMRRQP